MSDPTPVPERVTASMPERRSFLRSLLVAAGGLVSATLAIPLVRFATFPLRVREDDTSWSDVGKIEEFASLAGPVVRTIDVKRVDGWRSSAVQNGVYVLPAENGKLRVLSSVCPHLGCSVRWIEKKNEFVCPCHGGTYTHTGARVSGPPLRAMDELECKVENGVLKTRFEYFRQLSASKEPVG
ncbi:MAG TPA: Rieske (2Fe-2S) protein [Terracidiphilus sp.]|nr:Rieske (2Fe-2S) protein [Terracidiphilus sp.]